MQWMGLSEALVSPNDNCDALPFGGHLYHRVATTEVSRIEERIGPGSNSLSLPVVNKSPCSMLSATTVLPCHLHELFAGITCETTVPCLVHSVSMSRTDSMPSAGLDDEAGDFTVAAKVSLTCHSLRTMGFNGCTYCSETRNISPHLPPRSERSACLPSFSTMSLCNRAATSEVLGTDFVHVDVC